MRDENHDTREREGKSDERGECAGQVPVRRAIVWQWHWTSARKRDDLGCDDKYLAMRAGVGWAE